MSDVIEMVGNCEGESCKRAEIIIRKDELVVVDGKKYHKGCQPTEEERKAKAKSYT
jgi:hypothetical protein